MATHNLRASRTPRYARSIHGVQVTHPVRVMKEEVVDPVTGEIPEGSKWAWAKNGLAKLKEVQANQEWTQQARQQGFGRA